MNQSTGLARWISLIALNVTLAASGATVSASENPFHVDYQLHQATLTPTSPGVFSVSEVGAGVGTELGKFTWSSQEEVSFVAVPGRIVVSGGLYTFVAANGDILYATYETEGSLPDENGDMHFDGTYAITGGTGRFANATGGGVLSFDANIISLTGAGTLDGVIDRHNNRK